MKKTDPARKPKTKRLQSPLLVRLDEESKAFLVRAAELRKISISDYVRTVTVSQARRELEAADERILALTKIEQLAFWNALHAGTGLTAAQRDLASAMRGEA